MEETTKPNILILWNLYYPAVKMICNPGQGHRPLPPPAREASLHCLLRKTRIRLFSECPGSLKAHSRVWDPKSQVFTSLEKDSVGGGSHVTNQHFVKQRWPNISVTGFLRGSCEHPSVFCFVVFWCCMWMVTLSFPKQNTAFHCYFLRCCFFILPAAKVKLSIYKLTKWIKQQLGWSECF